MEDHPMYETKTMSNFEVLRFIRDARSTKGADRAVLNALALRANPNARYSCYPSLQTIADDTMLSVRQVQRALPKLRQANLITYKKRDYKSNYYWINVAELSSQAGKNQREVEATPECPFDAVQESGNSDHTAAAPAVKPAPILDAQLNTLMVEIRDLAHVGEKLSAKDAEFIATSLSGYGEAARLLAVATLDNSQLERASKVGSPAGYLITTIKNQIDTMAKDEGEVNVTEVVQDIPGDIEDVLAGTLNRLYFVDVNRPNALDVFKAKIKTYGQQDVEVGDYYPERKPDGSLTLVLPLKPLVRTSHEVAVAA
jgi:Helix-turn-helix domain